MRHSIPTMKASRTDLGTLYQALKKVKRGPCIQKEVFLEGVSETTKLDY